MVLSKLKRVDMEKNSPMNKEELRNSLAIEIFNKCEKPLEYVTKLCIADAEDGELRGMAVREYQPDVIKTRYAKELANMLLPFIKSRNQQTIFEAKIQEVNSIPHHLLHIPEVWDYKQQRLAKLKEEKKAL